VKSFVNPLERLVFAVLFFICYNTFDSPKIKTIYAIAVIYCLITALLTAILQNKRKLGQ